MKKRSFLFATFGIACLPLVARREAFAQAEENELQIGLDAPLVFPEGEKVPTLQEYSEGQRGTERPTDEEIENARQILAACEGNQRPIDVANFFLGVREGSFNDSIVKNAHLYCEEWPVRANPIIVSFFDATTLRKPAGDQTAWCAAFTEFCIAKGRDGAVDSGNLLARTKSAASASYRSWGTETTKPIEGDLVVFAHNKDKGKGHVAFFVSRNEKGVYCLGGNQMPLRARIPDGTYERRNTGEINVKWMPYQGRDLSFHSFRTDRCLHLGR